MILKKKVFGSAMLAAAIMSAGTCTAMAAPQQENTAIEAESENSTQTAAGLALKITEGFQNADEQASIEKKEVEVVKASEEEPQDEWQNRLMANVEESLNVRTEASEESALAGKLRKGDVAEVTERGEEWSKITSGNVSGYVKNEFCVFGDDAHNYANENCTTNAKVLEGGLRLRAEASEEAQICDVAAQDDVLTVKKDVEAPEGWVAVSHGDGVAYVSSQYVEVSLATGTGITVEEEQAIIAKQKAEEEAKKKAEAEAKKKAEEEAKKKAEAEAKKKAEAEAKAKAEEARKILEAAKKAEEEALKAAEQADSIQIDLTQPAEEGKLPLAASYLEKYTKMEKSGKSLVDTFNAITVDQENRNVCMMGDHGFGLTSVGEDFARSFYDMGICKAKTIAKIKAQALNKVKLADAMSKLAGGCMVVENAGLIAPDKMTELMKLTAKDVNDVVVILTGATESINRLFGATGDAKDKFTHQINMEGISTQDMLAIAKGYFKQQGFKTDDSVEGTVKNLLMAMESGNIDRMLKACDEAMLKCDDREKAKGSSRKYLLSEDFK